MDNIRDSDTHHNPHEAYIVITFNHLIFICYVFVVPVVMVNRIDVPSKMDVCPNIKGMDAFHGYEVKPGVNA